MEYLGGAYSDPSSSSGDRISEQQSRCNTFMELDSDSEYSEYYSDNSPCSSDENAQTPTSLDSLDLSNEMLLKTCSSAVAAIASIQANQPVVPSEFDQCNHSAPEMACGDATFDFISRIFHHGGRAGLTARVAIDDHTLCLPSLYPPPAHSHSRSRNLTTLSPRKTLTQIPHSNSLSNLCLVTGLRSEASVLVFGMVLLRRVAGSVSRITTEIVAVSLLTAAKLNFDRVQGNRYWVRLLRHLGQL